MHWINSPVLIAVAISGRNMHERNMHRRNRLLLTAVAISGRNMHWRNNTYSSSNQWEEYA